MALVAVAVTFSQQRRSHRLAEAALEQDRALNEANAERAEAAARLTEDYTRRVVDALESMAANGMGGGAAPAPKVAWAMWHESGDTYRLTNVGDAQARDVQVTSDPSLELLAFSGGPDLGSGEAMTFMAAPDLGTRDMTVQVQWTDDFSGEPQTWRYPLPYASRR